VSIAGAPSLRYKAIVGVIDTAKGAGVDRVGIITQRMDLRLKVVRTFRSAVSGRPERPALHPRLKTR
jgi:hypothetical protein